MKTFIVLVTRGRGTSNADFAEVYTFNTHEQAREICKKLEDATSKHWTKAEIVLQGEVVELDSPHIY